MKSYLLFVLILTLFYLIYYAVTIFRDLNGKAKGQKKDEEVFTIDADENDSVEVSESEEGFNIGNEKYVLDYDKHNSEDAEPSSTEKNEDAESRVEKFKAVADEQMEEVHAFMSDPCNEEELQRMIIEKGIINGKADMQWKAAKNEI